jgi:hypothetical protein
MRDGDTKRCGRRAQIDGECRARRMTDHLQIDPPAADNRQARQQGVAEPRAQRIAGQALDDLVTRLVPQKGELVDPGMV